MKHSDWIREAVIRRVAELELTAYAVSKRSGGAVTAEHVRRFLTRQAGMASGKLSHVLRAVGLDLAERSPAKERP